MKKLMKSTYFFHKTNPRIRCFWIFQIKLVILVLICFTFKVGFSASSDEAIEEIWEHWLFQPGMDVLDSDCIGNCKDDMVIGAVLLSPPGKYSQLYDKIKTKDENCQRNLLSTLARKLETMEVLELCLQTVYRQSSLCADVLKYVSIVQDRISGLMKLAYGSNVLRTMEAKAPCLDCANRARRKTFTLTSPKF